MVLPYRWRCSLHALCGVHCLAAGVMKLVSTAPLLAGLALAGVGIVAVQMAVLAACTRRL
jgi:hypothetical protein